MPQRRQRLRTWVVATSVLANHSRTNAKFVLLLCRIRVKELRDTTNFFLKNTYKSLQDLFSGSHYIETKKMASLIFLFSNILAREGVIIEQKSRKIA